MFFSRDVACRVSTCIAIFLICFRPELKTDGMRIFYHNTITTRLEKPLEMRLFYHNAITMRLALALEFSGY